ncbi:hypothetical protein, partial [Serratia marcescens]|uniref:hypothetical protein n=1 Tax=Serratia marcescens TaxID=615 RepID=UPI0034E2DD28
GWVPGSATRGNGGFLAWFRPVICLVYANFCLDIAIYDKPDTRRLASMLDVIENNYHEYALPAVGRADLVD